MMKKYPNHIVLGIGIMMTGAWLITNDRFFQWSPDTVEFANDGFLVSSKSGADGTFDWSGNL